MRTKHFSISERLNTRWARDAAIQHYERMLRSKSQAKSSLRPDVQYALGVAYEEVQRGPEAAGIYRKFLTEHRHLPLNQRSSNAFSRYLDWPAEI